MKNTELNLKSIQPIVGAFAQKIQRYSTVLLFMLFTVAYVYIIFQINSLNDPQVTQSAVTQEVESLPTPSLDEDAASKLESLKDNNVNVQVLFEESRTNPFAE